MGRLLVVGLCTLACGRSGVIRSEPDAESGTASDAEGDAGPGDAELLSQIEVTAVDRNAPDRTPAPGFVVRVPRQLVDRWDVTIAARCEVAQGVVVDYAELRTDGTMTGDEQWSQVVLRRWERSGRCQMDVMRWSTDDEPIHRRCFDGQVERPGACTPPLTIAGESETGGYPLRVEDVRFWTEGTRGWEGALHVEALVAMSRGSRLARLEIRGISRVGSVELVDIGAIDDPPYRNGAARRIAETVFQPLADWELEFIHEGQPLPGRICYDVDEGTTVSCKPRSHRRGRGPPRLRVDSVEGDDEGRPTFLATVDGTITPGLHLETEMLCGTRILSGEADGLPLDLLEPGQSTRYWYRALYDHGPFDGCEYEVSLVTSRAAGRLCATREGWRRCSR